MTRMFVNVKFRLLFRGVIVQDIELGQVRAGDLVKLIILVMRCVIVRGMKGYIFSPIQQYMQVTHEMRDALLTISCFFCRRQRINNHEVE
jgi:hypothetical protein